MSLGLEKSAGLESSIELNGSQKANPPTHVAMIMDGNGRWAKQRRLPRLEGHRAGAKAVRRIVEESRKLGIRYLTLFSFSTENWMRSASEVSGLMRLFREYLDSELASLLKNDIRLRAIGDLERLPSNVKDPLLRDIQETKDNCGMDLILAISYGGREEIVSATKSIATQVCEGKIGVEEINTELFC